MLCRTVRTRAIICALLWMSTAPRPVAADCGLRPGIHGAGGCSEPLPAQVGGAQSVRFLLTDADIATIVADPTAFDSFVRSLAANCIDVVITIRVVDPADGAFDTIPPASQQAAVLDDLRTFVAMFGPWIDACQIGNEIFGGPGTYRIGGRTAEQWTDADFDALRSWLDAQAAAVDAGAADASATVGLISPALTAGLTRRGALGVWRSTCGPEPTCPPEDCGSPCYTVNPLATRLVDFIIAFGNETADMVDQHLHVRCRDELASTIALLRQNPCGLLADTPRALTCLEWSPAHAARDWLNEPSLAFPGSNADEMFDFLQRVEWCALGPSCALCAPVAPTEWDDFLTRFDAHLMSQTGDDLAAFISRTLADMSAAGFQHACYSTLSQLGLQDAARLAQIRQCMDLSPATAGDIYFFDVTALRADATVGAANACDAVWSSVVRSAVEAGFAAYAASACPAAPGDLTCDDAVDAQDAAVWLACMGGPDAPVSYDCRDGDFDSDRDADLNDFALLQRAVTSAP